LRLIISNKMEDQRNLQAQIDELKRRMDNLNASQTIPLATDQAFNSRGFLKTSFFVAGTGTIASNGEYRLVIPGATRTSIVLAQSWENSVAAMLTPGFGSVNFGSSTSQFDITNPGGSTFRYTWDGTGTNPGINATTLPTGSRVVIFSPNFNVANQNSASRPFFIVTGSGANYFEVDNFTPGVVESNVTIGTNGSISGGAQNNTYELLVQGTATDIFSFVVFLFPKLYIQDE